MMDKCVVLECLPEDRAVEAKMARHAASKKPSRGVSKLATLSSQGEAAYRSRRLELSNTWEQPMLLLAIHEDPEYEILSVSISR
jgi:hypothetical protein